MKKDDQLVKTYYDYPVYENADAAEHITPPEVPPMNSEFSKASTLLVDVIDCLPPGVDRGCAKLAASYKAVELVMRLEGGQSTDSEKVNKAIHGLAGLETKLDEYQQRADSLSKTFWGRVNKCTQGVMSFLAESSAILTATVGSSLLTTGAGSLAASTTFTYPQVFGSTLLQKMEESGYDLKDPKQIKDALDNNEFMKHAKKASHISAGKMTGAVFLAGVAAGYVHSVAAKPVEQAGSNLAREVLEKVTGQVSEKSAQAAGQGAATLARSGVNAASKQALASIPIRSFNVASKAACEAAKEAVLKTPVVSRAAVVAVDVARHARL